VQYGMQNNAYSFYSSHINVFFNICTDVPSAESEIGNC